MAMSRYLVAGLCIFRRGRWTGPRNEKVIEIRVLLESRVGFGTESFFPAVEVGGADLIVATALHHEDGNLSVAARSAG
jgi:hypothetical protein